MSEDNRTYNNRTGKNTGNNRRYSGSKGGANRPETRTSDRNGRGRSLNDYSVDVAAQRGVMRDDSALRRNKRPGDVKMAETSSAITAISISVITDVGQKKQQDAGRSETVGWWAEAEQD